MTEGSMTKTRTVDRQIIVRGRQIVALTLASMALSGLAHSQQAMTRARDLQAAGQSAFLRTDTDRNGRLSRQEVDQRMPGIAAKFEHFDRNRDASLSREEFLSGYTAKE
jgi:hypothetical protein